MSLVILVAWVAKPQRGDSDQEFAYAAVPAHSDNATTATSFDMVFLLNNKARHNLVNN
jgi:hypothetical protein